MRNRQCDFRSARITCPFFRGHTPTEIGCEGITDETLLKLIFPDRAVRDTHEDIFCMKHFEKCELYEAINKKYDD
jgi:hypothetical protein